VSAKIDLGTALREALPTYNAPPSLHEWARERAPADDVGALAPAGNKEPLRATSVVRLPLYAAGLLVASVLGWTASSSYRLHQQSVASQDALIVELVDTHVRSLMGDHLMDVRSTDEHTVKPWFAGKTDFAPRVLDLTAKGFPLLGGRIEYIRGHTAAALVYGRRRHIVNLFMWPAAASENAQASRQYHGYSTLHWVADGLSYWAVSDAAPAELEAFRQAYESAT
jgi:anti-sigma factor RsiW